LHPLAETNVHAVTEDRGAALLHFDTSAEEEGLTDLKAELKSAESDFAETEDQLQEVKRDLLRANALLDEIKGEEPDEKGRTLRQYIEDAEQADMRAANWKAAYDKIEAELKELRRRKSKPKAT
jgi:chromosome segregation ATPase